jgi:hypothetical protein
MTPLMWLRIAVVSAVPVEIPLTQPASWLCHTSV